MLYEVKATISVTVQLELDNIEDVFKDIPKDKLPDVALIGSDRDMGIQEILDLKISAEGGESYEIISVNKIT